LLLQQLCAILIRPESEFESESGLGFGSLGLGQVVVHLLASGGGIKARRLRRCLLSY